ncbi:MAG TPA: protein kinase [Polyangiaceae bacterium]
MKTPTEASIIAGKYRLLRKLGQGAMGAVWQAEHLTLKSQVAVKFIQVDTALHAEALPRFLREAQAAASLRSPHVVQILDHGVDDGVPYIAMELLEGETLAARLERVGHLEAVEMSRIMTQVGRAIARAHEAGIIHRDLKPDNVFMVRNDDEELVKVLDFGIAKSGGAESLDAPVAADTRTGAVMGTPYYMSPEQTQGAKGADARSDIWSLGVVAFECLVGRRPFEAETLGGLLLAICTKPMPVPSELAVVPAGFDAWFARACARDVKERFASAKEAIQNLRSVCEGSTAGANPASLWPVASAATPAPSQVGSALSASGGPAGPAEGFASTNTREASAPLKKPTPKLAWVLAASALIAVVSAVFLLKSQTVPSSPAAALPSSNALGGPSVASSVTAAPSASVAPRASSAPSAATTTQVVSTPPLPRHDEHPARSAPTPHAASSAAPWPSNASSVNLGL